MNLNAKETLLVWSALEKAAKDESNYYTSEEKQKLAEIADFILTIDEISIDENPF